MAQFLALPEDIVVSKIRARQGSVGLVSETQGPVTVTIHYRVLVPDRARVLPQYAWLAMRSGYARAHFLSATGGAMKGEISEEALLEIPIPLPPLPTQEAIVEYWWKAQKHAIRTRDTVAALEEEIPLEIYKSLGTPRPTPDSALPKHLALNWSQLDRWSFNYIARARQGLLGFTRARYPIQRLGEHLLDTMNGYCIKPVQLQTPHKMLKLSALTPAGLDVQESKFVKVSDRIARRFHIRKGDLLICRSVGSYDYVAKCALVEEDRSDLLFPDIIIRSRFKESVLPEFAREVIQTSLGRSYFKSNARTAVGMWKIGAEDIRNFPIPVPPMEVQRQIVDMVNEKRARVAEERRAAEERKTRATREIEEMILGVRSVEYD